MVVTLSTEDEQPLEKKRDDVTTEHYFWTEPVQMEKFNRILILLILVEVIIFLYFQTSKLKR